MASCSIALGAYVGRVITDDEDVLTQLREIFYEETDQRKLERDKTLHEKTFYVNTDGYFMVGLASFIVDALEILGVRYKIQDYRGDINLPSREKIAEIIESLPKNLRYYQEEGIYDLLSRPNGIVEVGTGGGKTIMMTTVIRALDDVTLIPLKNKDLAKQVRREMAEALGVPLKEIGFIGGGKFIVKKFTVGIVNTLSKPKCADYLETVKVMVTDECHNGTSNMYDTVQRGAKNCAIRYGFSATPIQPKVRTAENGWERTNFDLVGRFGPIVVSKPVSALVKEGFLATPTCHFVVIDNEPTSDDDLLEYHEEYQRMIVDNDLRLEMSAQITVDHYLSGEKVLLFVSHIAHGLNLLDRLNELGVSPKDVGFANGQNIAHDRETVIADFKQDRLKVLVGIDKILSEGINFVLDACLNCCGGRSDRSVIQKIGRLLRKPIGHSGDVDITEFKHVDYYDFIDDNHPILIPQSWERFRTIQSLDFETSYERAKW